MKTMACALGFLCVLMNGCAQRPQPFLAGSGAASGFIFDVPFFPDSTDQCGPSTLASILNYWHKPADPAELRREIYLPKLRGTLPMDLLPAVEARGLAARVYNGSLDDLKDNIRAGRPVLAYLNLGYSFAPAGHYVVVTGFDDGQRGLYMHSGKHKNKFISYRKFLRSWDKTDRWSLLVSPVSSASTRARP